MICPHCQKEHPDNARFCPLTGKPITSGRVVCPNCGNPIIAEVRFCPRCGYQLVQPTKEKPKISPIYPILIVIGIITISVGAYFIWKYLLSGQSDPAEEEINLIALQFEKVEGVNFPERTLFINAPQGDRFVTAFEDQFTYRDASDYAPLCVASASSRITSLAFTPDGSYLVTGSIDGSWSVWRLMDCQLTYTLQGLDGQVTWIAVSPDGMFGVAGGESGEVWHWELDDPNTNRLLSSRGGEISHIAISEDGKLLVVCLKTGRIEELDASSGEIIQTIDLPGGYAFRSLLSAGGDHLVISSEDGIKLYDVNTGNLLHFFYESAGISDRIAGRGYNNWYALTPNGAYLICGCDGDLLVWRMPTGELVQSIELGDEVYSGILINANGQLILNSMGDDNSYNYLWGRVDQEISGVPPVPPTVAISPPPVAQTATEPAPAVTEPLLSPTDTTQPSQTPTTLPSSTPIPTPSNTPFVEVVPVDIKINPLDGVELVFVPAGEFIMGSGSDTDPYFYGAEGPPHQVYLDDFWIYRTEVTNRMYAKCTDEKKCPLPAGLYSNTRNDYFKNPIYEDYPVVNVNWKMASAYCRWAGGRMPTEAEWEKAARGTDQRLFAWGNEPPNSQLANYLSNDTVAVGSYPAGASPYGAYDMSGNVIEWVFDYFFATYYQSSPEENPRGPASGSTRVYRSGSYHNSAEAIRVVMRGSRSENHAQVDIGFRCVIDD